MTDHFADIRDKRMSELNDEQKDRAYELWLRKEMGHRWPLRDVCEALLRVIDRLREDRPVITWTDSEGVKHLCTFDGARETLARFYEEWPGGWSEVEADNPSAYFNAAIDFAISQGLEAATFLDAWRHGDTSEWSEFKPGQQRVARREQIMELVEDYASATHVGTHESCMQARAEVEAALDQGSLSDAAMQTISRWLADDMEVAVSNGANSVSMPDELVEIAAWLSGVQRVAPQPLTGDLLAVLRELVDAEKAYREARGGPWVYKNVPHQVEQRVRAAYQAAHAAIERAPQQPAPQPKAVDPQHVYALARAVRQMRAISARLGTKDDPYGGLMHADDADTLEELLAVLDPTSVLPVAQRVDENGGNTNG